MEDRIYKKYFIGRSKPGQWSSVYVYKPQSREINVKRGEIFAIISLTGPESFAVSTAGNLILDNLHEMYFENKEDSALIALEKAVKGASTYLQKLLENDSAADVGIDFDLITMTVLGDIVYYVSLGNNVAKVWRDGRLTDVAQLLKDPTGEGLIQVGSMVGGAGDIYFLASEQFEKEAMEDSYIELAESFSDLPLKQRIYEKEARIAFVMVGYNLDFEHLQKSAIQEVEDLNADSAKAESEDTAEITEVTASDNDEVIDTEESEQDGYVIEEVSPTGKSELKQQVRPESKEEFLDDLQQDITEEFEEQLDEQLEEQEFEDRSLVKVKQQSIVERIKLFASKIKLPNMPLKPLTIKRNVPSSRVQALDDKPTFFYWMATLGDKFKGMVNVVWEDWLGMGKGSRNLRGGNRNKKWGFLLILAIVIGGMIYFSYQDMMKAQKQKDVERQAQTYLSEATSKFDALETDAKIIAKSDLNTARKDAFLKELQSGQTILDKARGVEKIANDVKLQDERVQRIEDLLNKTITIQNLDQIVDMGAKNPGSSLSDIAIGNKQVFFSDEKYGKIFAVSYDGKTEKEIATGLISPTSLTYDPNGNLIFIDKTTDRKIGAINVYDMTLQRIAGTSESKLGGVTQIEFAIIDSKAKQYRLFAIDPVNKAVYHLESRDSLAFGLPVKRAITIPELAEVKDLSINDLKIYLDLPFGQGFYRALGDKNDTPEVSGLASTDSFKNSSAFFVDDLYMYVADSSSQSIYVITKDNNDNKAMQFKAKYKYRGSESYFKNIKDLVVDRTAGKIFVLDGSRIFVLPMSELNNF